MKCLFFLRILLSSCHREFESTYSCELHLNGKMVFLQLDRTTGMLCVKLKGWLSLQAYCPGITLSHHIFYIMAPISATLLIEYLWFNIESSAERFALASSPCTTFSLHVIALYAHYFLITVYTLYSVTGYCLL